MQNSSEKNVSTGGSNTLLAAVLNAIYWVKFTPNQSEVITNIIKDETLDATSKANEICNFLGIERRGNRSAIRAVLSNGS